MTVAEEKKRRKRANASPGLSAMRKFQESQQEGSEDIVPLGDLPVEDDVESSPINNRAKDRDEAPASKPAAKKPSETAIGAAVKTGTPTSDRRSNDSAGTVQPVTGYESTQNFFIPARKIRDWKYNDRTQAAVLSDPKFPELTESIRLAGRLVEAIVVRKLSTPDKDGYEFEQIIGCKRLTACKLIDPNFPVECSIQELTDAEAAALQAAENKGRSDPPIWDRGCAWADLLESGVYTSVRELAAALGEKHEKTVGNYVRFARTINSEPEFRSLPLSLLSQGALELIAAIAKGKNRSDDERDEVVQRIVEIEDDIRKRPETAIRLIEKAVARYEAERSGKSAGNLSAAKPKVYQSEHGKTMTLSRKNDEFKLTLHSDVAAEIDHEEVESLILDYLKQKGLHVKEKSSRK